MLGLNYTNLVDPILRHLRSQVPGFAGMPAGQSVLDVCCGTGAQVYEYAARGLKATGLDISSEMLNMRRRPQGEAFDYEPSFYLADAACMPFEDNLFDYVSVTLALHDKDDALQDSIISETMRVVKKGGGLVLMDYNAPASPSILGLLVKVIEFVAGGDHMRNYSSYMKKTGLRAILSRHALTVEKTQVLKSGIFRMVLCRPAEEFARGVCAKPA